MNDFPTQFGIFDIFQVDPDRPTQESLTEHIGHHVLADQLGFDYIFLAERHFMPFYRATSPGLIIAALSMSTSHARLGVLAYTAALHNPVLLAEEISSLDHLTDGRLEVGLGLGHRPQEIAGLGLPVEHRQAIFLENLLMMRDMWRGQPYAYNGALYHVRDIWVDPPAQSPHPPIWYAGGDPAATAWAARNGLSQAIGFQPDEDLLVPASAFHESEKNELAPRQRLALMRHFYVAETDEQAKEEIIDDLQKLGAALAADPKGLANAPTEPPSREEAEAQYEDQLKRQIIVAGGPETVARNIASSIEILKLDVVLANVHLMGVEDLRVRRTLTLLAEEVIPRVQKLQQG